MVKDDDIEHQLKQIEHYASLDHNCDLICFGKSFLQGFDGLTWKYDQDIKRALTKDHSIIYRIPKITETFECGISFGFIERNKRTLYSSNMYKEGQEFHTFTYMDKMLGTAICGDIWGDHLLKDLEGMKMDALLWPVYIDYSVTQWNRHSRKQYVGRTQNLPYPVLTINSFCEDNNRAKVGCYVFHHNRIAAYLPLGNTGVLEFELD